MMPASGMSSRLHNRSNVVLPAPDGPVITVMPAAGIRRRAGTAGSLPVGGTGPFLSGRGLEPASRKAADPGWAGASPFRALPGSAVPRPPQPRLLLIAAAVLLVAISGASVLEAARDLHALLAYARAVGPS